MRQLFHKILFFLTILILTTILVQTVTSYFQLKPLRGALVKAEKPNLSFASYVDGSFQSGLENYARDNFGFHEWLIRFYNQYLYTCFHKTNNASILFGKDDWLFESDFVKDHYESMMYNYASNEDEMRAIFEKEALRLWKVQELLKEYDIHIFVNIIPGKDVIYPEYLPENTSYFRPDGLHAYDFYKKRFVELGINHIDNVEIFKKIKNTVDYQLFTKTGTHWSNIASIYVFDSIRNYMEILGNKNLTNIEIGQKYEDATREPDNDLEQLLNLTCPMKSKTNLYADVKAIQDSTAVKPYFTVIGDSYFWNFMYNIPMYEIFSKIPYWYYNSTIYNDDNYHSTLELDFEAELMRTDYIMLNYCTVQLYNLGNNFISKALVYLCYDKQTIVAVAQNVINSIKSNEEWYQQIVEKARANNVSLEEELYNNAIYVICLEPEKYFDELNGDQLPVSRNSKLKQLRGGMAETEVSNDELHNLINYIYSDENWLNKIKAKAKQNGISVKEQVELDARWTLENQ